MTMKNPTKKLILSDADGVLLNWEDGFVKYMKSFGFEMKRNDVYNLGTAFGMPYEEAMKYAMAFNETEIFNNLEPYKDALEWVPKLAEKGFKFAIISSMSVDPVIRIHRIKNLRRLYGSCIEDMHGLNPTDDKQRVLSLWGDSGLFWLEDHFKNASAGHEEGLRPILVDTAYNAHYQTDLFPRTSRETPWADIYRIITESYDGWESAS